VSTTHNIAQRHPNRWMLPLAAVSAVAMLVTWFPLGTLWRQQHQLDATAAQISALRGQQQTLSAESRSISSKATSTLLARQEYQLVAPGQSLIQVLPGSAGSDAPQGGDPGYQPLVSPSSVSSLVPGVRATAPKRHGTLSGFVSRLVRTLEFWR
jgi:hypothetical protein